MKNLFKINSFNFLINAVIFIVFASSLFFSIKYYFNFKNFNTQELHYFKSDFQIYSYNNFGKSIIKLIDLDEFFDENLSQMIASEIKGFNISGKKFIRTSIHDSIIFQYEYVDQKSLNKNLIEKNIYDFIWEKNNNDIKILIRGIEIDQEQRERVNLNQYGENFLSPDVIYNCVQLFQNNIDDNKNLSCSLSARNNYDYSYEELKDNIFVSHSSSVFTDTHLIKKIDNKYIFFSIISFFTFMMLCFRLLRRSN